MPLNHRSLAIFEPTLDIFALFGLALQLPLGSSDFVLQCFLFLKHGLLHALELSHEVIHLAFDGCADLLFGLDFELCLSQLVFKTLFGLGLIEGLILGLLELVAQILNESACSLVLLLLLRALHDLETFPLGSLLL